jgi:hypothetical protein
MYCSNCGQWHGNNAMFCTACGTALAVQTVPLQVLGGGLVEPNSQPKRFSVILLIFLTIITGGIFAPIWLLRVRKSVNSLQSSQKLGREKAITAIVFMSIAVILLFISSATTGNTTPDTPTIRATILDTSSRLFSAVAGLGVLIESFTVRRIFNEHVNGYLGRNIVFSGAATFFFTIYYLQYKANRF